jgi:branched-chain amino acid transport system ATP-binding protein
MTLLELNTVKKSYGALTVVNDVSLKVSKGESIGIIGPNGAGKSSLFHVITGVVPIDSGEILLNGKNIQDEVPHERCRAGIARAYQVPRPFSGMSVFENLLVGATFGADLSLTEAKDKCAMLLKHTGLEKVANQPAGSLRLLDRKRLELAKALSTDPQLLLLDEIAGGLTEDECDELMKLIQTAQSSGITVIWIEHVVRTLMQFAKRLIVLDFGSVLADGIPKNVWARDDVQKRYVGIEA